MAGLNESTVQVLLDLRPRSFTFLPQNYITLRLRDLETRHVQFQAFRSFCQHFLYDHKLYPYYNFGTQFVNFLTTRFVVLNLSNEVLLTLLSSNYPTTQFLYAMGVAMEFHMREVDWPCYADSIWRCSEDFSVEN